MAQVVAPPAGSPPGFMGTLAPNNMTWQQYCETQAPMIDDSTGFPAGAWGQCVASAKKFESQNSNWQSDPAYADDGPCGQAIAALQKAGGPEDVEAANRLEQACEEAAANGRPFPLIG
eukprot:gnl/TRDRNA2_/TRDRNA2_143470_c0_seq1.p3 gnl/TRDRNA2_/TRDRNA2_143470_c0~~gnl/TRDRNA2_/TRDRNA2_143470_c0_seq1.p3  ORF type:complete len:118 (+),score=23.50 gnl/TRDRNA2_/TRDRNA2_143470_c0_seq1:602-955(+)